MVTCADQPPEGWGRSPETSIAEEGEAQARRKRLGGWQQRLDGAPCPRSLRALSRMGSWRWLKEDVQAAACQQWGPGDFVVDLGDCWKGF